MNILLLAAGKGQRFQDVGYPPKPLIELAPGLPMWEAVLSNFLTQLPGEHVVNVVTKVEYEIVSSKYNIINLTGPQKGAAYSAVEGLVGMNPDEPLWILNCDQLIDFHGDLLIDHLDFYKPDGCLIHFTEPNGEWKWGRSRVVEFPWVDAIAEKTPISVHAHCGYYYYNRTWMFETMAMEMMAKNIKVNDEFFISPTYQLMLEKGMAVSYFKAVEFNGIGIPEDLEIYLNKAAE